MAVDTYALIIELRFIIFIEKLRTYIRINIRSYIIKRSNDGSFEGNANLQILKCIVSSDSGCSSTVVY